MRCKLRLDRAAFLVVLVALVACGPTEMSGTGSQNVLLVTFDTTRADHLGPYGDTSAHTPALDRLAAEGTVFEQCLSAVPITVPSHSTIFTGTYPNVHGVRDNGLYVLSGEHTTLAEILQLAGWRTAAATSSFVLDSQFGTDQGFEVYDDDVTSESKSFWGVRTDEKNALFFDERSADGTIEAVLPWLRERSVAGEPFFLWVHLWSPHHPLIPPAPWNELFATDLYRGEIATADAALGRLLGELDKLGEYDSTTVVMTADHGEGQGEHGEETHALLAHDATLHVPLIVKMPQGQAQGHGGRRISERVGTVDIAPTLLELLDLPIPDEMQGRSLAGHLFSGPDVSEPDPKAENQWPYYAETLSPRLSHGWGELRAWYEGPWKYIHGPRPELYHLASDPGELNERGSTEPEVVAAMRSELANYLALNSRPANDVMSGIDPEVMRRLESLGYVSSGGDAPDSITDVLRDGGIPPRDRVGDVNLWSRAKHHLARGEYLPAKEAVTPLLAEAPDNVVYLAMAAWAEMGLGHDQAAAQLMERVPEIPTGYGPLVAQIAMSMERRGEHDTALELIDRVLVTQALANVWVLRAGLFQDKDLEEFERSLEAALVVDETYAPAHVELATSLAGRGQNEAAGKHFVTALEHDPLSVRAHYNYGILLSRLDRWPEARRHFARATGLAPEACSLRLALLTAQVELGESTTAVETRKQIGERCVEAEIEQAEKLMEKLVTEKGLFEILGEMEDTQ